MDEKLAARIKEIERSKYDDIEKLYDRIDMLEDCLYEATRERKKEDKSCLLCGQNKVIWWYEPNDELVVNDDADSYDGVSIRDGYLVYDNSGDEYNASKLPIKYCPLCGKKLS
jgi:hypothetical protein